MLRDREPLSPLLTKEDIKKMQTFEAIVTRRSTRSYKPDPVEAEKMDRILEAGRYAPSGSNSQQNHFLVITDEQILSKLAEYARNAFAKMEITEGMYVSLRNSILLSKKGDYRFCYNAPVLVVIANQKDYGNNIADVVAAAENMMILANELDLGSCYINQLKWLNEEPSLVSYLQSLGMKETERVYGSVIFGYPDTADGLPIRKPLERKGNVVTYVK